MVAFFWHLVLYDKAIRVLGVSEGAPELRDKLANLILLFVVFFFLHVNGAQVSFSTFDIDDAGEVYVTLVEDTSAQEQSTVLKNRPFSLLWHENIRKFTLRVIHL